jgi:phosphatidylethanolamine/phosphatidyl-N-methylethanolamine N-methyltransferase
MMRISEEHVIRAYRRYAPVYDSLYGAVLEPGRRALSRAVASLQPGSILEIGVGTGLMLASYPAGAKLVGIDISDEMLRKAQQRLSKLNGRDCVTLPYVLSVTPDPDRLIAEARRVCRKDGTIFILNHFSGSRFWWCLERAVRPIADRIGFRSDFSFEERILKHDWEVRSVRSVNLMGLSRLVEVRNA